MSLQAFFQQFSVLSNAPNSIPQLRELILQLAVRGQLGTQNPNDEPASSLLRKLRRSRDRLIEDKKIRTTKSLPAIQSSEVPFSIPQTWQWIRLGEIGDWGAGATPNRKNPRYYGGDIDWFKSGELNNGLIRESEERITQVALKECSLRLNQPGDVLIAMYGATIGKLAILETGATTNQAVCACTCFEGVDNQYLFLLLRSYRRHFAGRGAGGAQPNISREKIIHTVAPLPPLEEQKRMVVRVDQLMWLCDEMEARQRATKESQVRLNTAILAPLNKAASLTPEEFDQATTRLTDNFDTLYDSIDTVSKLRSTILQLAVQGKLLPQDLSNRPVFDERNSRLLAHEILFRSPDSWEWKRFGEVAEIVSGITKGRKLQGRKTYSYPYLRVANVQRWFLDLRVMKEIEILEGEIEKYRLQQDDLLITEGGDWDKVGRTAIWDNQIKNCVHQNHVFRARLSNKKVMPFWAMMFMNSATGRRYFEAASKQTTNLASINMRQLRACPLPIPPLAEQKRIVARVNQLMSLCDELEAKLRQAEADSEKLMNAAVKHVLDSVRNASKTAEEVFA